MKLKNFMLTMNWVLCLCLLSEPSISMAGSKEQCQRAIHNESDASDSEKKVLASRQSRWSIDEQEALSVAPKFFEYMKQGSSQVREREFLIEIMMLAWLSKEHILLLGAPGNAKTMVSKLLMSQVKEKSTGQPSFFSLQMTAETSLSDTHGGIDYKILNETGRQRRLYDEGALDSHFDLFDEQFDMRPNGYRNVLDLLAERAHSQGNQTHHGKIWTVVGASNSFIPEVFAKFDGSEQPRALIDRYAFVILVPSELEHIENNRSLIKGAQVKRSPLPELYFEDIEKLQALVPQVEIPDHVADLLTLIQYRLRPVLEKAEQASVLEYNEKVQNGEKPLPPARSTKYMSPRTLGKAGGILKAMVVLDFLRKKGQRKLTANTEDLKELYKFYALNGVRDEFLQVEMMRASKDVEKEQLRYLQFERRVVKETIEKTIEEYKQALSSFAVPDIHAQVLNYPNLNVYQKRMLMDAMAKLYREGHEVLFGAQADQTPDKIAKASMIDVIEEWVRYIEPAKQNQILASWKRGLPLKPKKLRNRYGTGENQKQTKVLLPNQKRQQSATNKIDGHLLTLPAEQTKYWMRVANNNNLTNENLVAGMYFEDSHERAIVYVSENGLVTMIPRDLIASAFNVSSDFKFGTEIVPLGPFLRDYKETKLFLIGDFNREGRSEPLYEVPMPSEFKSVNPDRLNYSFVFRDKALWGIGREIDFPDFKLNYSENLTNPFSNGWSPLDRAETFVKRDTITHPDIDSGPYPYSQINLRNVTLLFEGGQRSSDSGADNFGYILDFERRMLTKQIDSGFSAKLADPNDSLAVAFLDDLAQWIRFKLRRKESGDKGFNLIYEREGSNGAVGNLTGLETLHDAEIVNTVAWSVSKGFALAVILRDQGKSGQLSLYQAYLPVILMDGVEWFLDSNNIISSLEVLDSDFSQDLTDIRIHATNENTVFVTGFKNGSETRVAIKKGPSPTAQ